MKRILSIIAGLVIGFGMVANAVPNLKNAQIIWHGNANQPPSGATGWWESAIPYDQTTAWWYYAPNVSATVEMYSVDKIVRYWWGMTGVPVGYTYQGYDCGSTSMGTGNTASTMFTLDTEVGEEWFSGDWAYFYVHTKQEWYLRVTLSSPWSSSASSPLPPGPTGGAATIEVVVWSFGNAFILGTYPLSIPEGAVTVDFAIDHKNYTASVINSWPGAAPGPLSEYYNATNYSPLYPTWAGWID